MKLRSLVNNNPILPRVQDNMSTGSKENNLNVGSPMRQPVQGGLRSSGSQGAIRVATRQGNSREKSNIRGTAYRKTPLEPQRFKLVSDKPPTNRGASKRRVLKTPDGTSYSIKKSNVKLAHMQEDIRASQKLFTELQELWKQNNVPLNHQTFYIEAISDLRYDIINQVNSQEIEDLKSNKAQILQVLKAIAAREKCIQMIRDSDKQEHGNMKKAEIISNGETKGLYLPP